MSFLKRSDSSLLRSIVLQMIILLVVICGTFVGSSLADTTASVEAAKKNLVQPELTIAIENKPAVKDIAEAWMPEHKVNEWQGGIDDMGVGGAAAGHAWDFDYFMGKKLEELTLPFGWGGAPMINFNPAELFGGTVSFSAKNNNSCNDYELGFKAGVKAGFLFIKLDAEMCIEGSRGPRCGCSLFGGCKCSWSFTIYPWSKYRYPTDKVETPEQAWRTRYMGKTNVEQLKNIIKNEPTEFTALRLNKILTYATNDTEYVQRKLGLKSGTAQPPVEAPTLKEFIKGNDLEKIKNARDGIGGEEFKALNSKEGFDSARTVEFHVVPELHSREAYEGIDAIKGLSLPFASVSITVPPVPPSITVSFGVKWAGSVCHTVKEPTKIAEYDPLKHFLGSEFPSAAMDTVTGTNVGLYPITRDPYAIYGTPELTSYRQAFMNLRKNPFICSIQNMSKGITPGGMIPDRIINAFAGADSTADAMCLKGNLGSVLPFVNWARVAHDTTASEVAFIRGMELGFKYKPQYFYKFDQATDAVQWISPDKMGGEDCTTDLEQPFSKFGFDSPSGDYANSQVPEDMPNVGVHWRKMWCCAEGSPFGFTPVLE